MTPTATSVQPIARFCSDVSFSLTSNAIPAPNIARVPAINPTSGMVITCFFMSKLNSGQSHVQGNHDEPALSRHWNCGPGTYSSRIVHVGVVLVVVSLPLFRHSLAIHPNDS